MKRILLLLAVASQISCSSSRNDNAFVGAKSGFDYLNASLQVVGKMPARKADKLAALSETSAGVAALNAIQTNHSILHMSEMTADSSSSSSGSTNFSFDLLAKAFSGDAAAIEEANKYSGGASSGSYLGSGPLVYDPSFTGGVQPGVASNSKVAQTICDFYISFFSFFGRCISTIDDPIDFKTIFGKDAVCENSILDALNDAGAKDISNEVVDALSCVSIQLGVVPCSGSDLSGSVFDALARCGFSFKH